MNEQEQGMLCNVIGILMMREGVEELILHVEELREMTKLHSGKILDFNSDGSVVHVRLMSDESSVQFQPAGDKTH